MFEILRFWSFENENITHMNGDMNYEWGDFSNNHHWYFNKTISQKCESIIATPKKDRNVGNLEI